MAMTPYSGETEIIGKLGTTPQERGLTTQQFKDKFDEGLKAFVQWFNDTHKTEFEAVQRPYIDGMEYLRFFHDKLRVNPFQQIKLIFSGDSTTYGTSILDDRFKINNICKTVLNKFGVMNVASINSGVEGIATQQWIDTRIALDMAQNPDLYIVRYGINDGSLPKETRLNTFTTNLRAGLATIRASKTVEQLSIILMAPNSTNDTVNGRDAEWYEQIVPVIKQAARDYQCCFIDTYNYLLDSTNAVWQDDMASNGVHIHPLEIGNAWIASLMADVLVPEALRNYGVTNVNSLDGVKTVSDAPSTYPAGVSIHRTDNTFPYDGHVITFFQANGVLLQFNSGLYAQSFEGIAVRRGLSQSGVPGGIGDNAWTNWIYIIEYEGWQDLTLGNGWVNYGAGTATAQYALDKGGNVHIKGRIKDGTTTYGTVIATLPVGRRLAQDRVFGVSSNGSFGLIEVKANGNIIVASIGSNAWVDFGDICFKAEA